MRSSMTGTGGTMAPAVLCPLDDHMGLDIARRLSAEGVTVYGIDTGTGVPGRHSRACTFVSCPYTAESDQRRYLEFLLDFGASLGTRAVLYPLSDRHVLLCSEYREQLDPYFAYVMPPHEMMVRLTTKDGLDSVSREHAVPAPQTYFLTGLDDIAEVAAKVPYPAILKPTESTYWHTPEITQLLRKGLLEGRAKVILCHTPEELTAAFEQIAAFDPRMIVQEVIPGEDSRLVYAPFYVDRAGVVRGIFTGRKHRVIPTGFGSASFVETYTDPVLQELVVRFLEAVGYRGLGGLEFKEDPRDGQYKLIEFNTRFGMWDGLGVHCGVDLPFISYRDALGLPVESQLGSAPGLKWVDWQRDFRAFMDYRRKGTLTYGAWRTSLRGPKVYAIYSREDWRPGVAFTWGLVKKLGNRTWRALGGRGAVQQERA